MGMDTIVHCSVETSSTIIQLLATIKTENLGPFGPNGVGICPAMTALAPCQAVSPNMSPGRYQLWF
jgi:hypothetical protein